MSISDGWSLSAGDLQQQQQHGTGTRVVVVCQTAAQCIHGKRDRTSARRAFDNGRIAVPACLAWCNASMPLHVSPDSDDSFCIFQVRALLLRASDVALGLSPSLPPSLPPSLARSLSLFAALPTGVIQSEAAAGWKRWCGRSAAIASGTAFHDELIVVC